MTALQLAWLTLSRKKISTVIAIGAISLSVGSGGMLLRLYRLTESRLTRLAVGADALVGAKNGGIEMILGALNGEGPYPGFLPMALFESLRDQQQVHFSDGADVSQGFSTAVIPFLYFAKLQNYRVVATDASFFHRVRVEQSPKFASGDWSENPKSIVVGSIVASRLGLKVGDSAQVQTWVGDEAAGAKQELQVAGVMAPTASSWDEMLFANVSTGQELLASVDLSQSSIWGNKVLNYFLIDLKPGGRGPLEALVNRRTVGQVVDVEQEKKRLEDLLGAGRALGLSLTILILALGGLSVASMLLSRFDGMATQIAVLRALGYRKLFIVEWLVLEGLLIGCVACLIGGTFDAILFPILRESFGAALPSADLIPSSVLQSAVVWVVAMMTTVFAVVFPIFRLQSQSLHQALRG